MAIQIEIGRTITINIKTQTIPPQPSGLNSPQETSAAKRGKRTVIAITVLFPLLAADVSWGELSPLGWGGIVCVFMLMVIVRPISIWIATMGRELELKEKLFLAWLAPRGIVTAAVASLFSIRLEQAGILGAGRLQGLVFLTILMTVGIQGLTAKPLVNRLELGKKKI